MRSVWGLWLVLACLLLGGCMAPPERPAGDGVRRTPLRTISTLEAKILLRLSGVQGVPVRYPVDCYRMEYAGPGGRRLSGLLAWPRGATPRRLVSFQHGTTTTPSAVPSAPDGTGLAAAIAFAGNGYLLVAPDYPGLGSSKGRHPYYVADQVGPSVVAMIEAAARLDSVLTPHYAAIVERVFAGAKPKEILAALPRDPRLMFNRAFLEAYDHGGPHWFLEALDANGLTQLTPRTPLRLYYGSQDKDVVPEESLAAARRMQARGADARAVDVGPVGHDASMLAAAPRILAWLNELEAAPQMN